LKESERKYVSGEKVNITAVWQVPPVAATGHRGIRQVSKAYGVSEFFLCLLLALEATKALRAAVAPANSRDAKESVFLGKRRCEPYFGDFADGTNVPRRAFAANRSRHS
jgi:hypothetical protein